MTNHERELDQIHSQLREINCKLDDLREWKWKIVGGAAVVSSLISGLGVLIGLLK